MGTWTAEQDQVLTLTESLTQGCVPLMRQTLTRPKTPKRFPCQDFPSPQLHMILERHIQYLLRPAGRQVGSVGSTPKSKRSSGVSTLT